MATVEFGTGKSVLILTIVAACFAILWPKIFYPMIVGQQIANRQAGGSSGCCDVIFETDVNTIRVLSEMCGRVLDQPGKDSKLAKEFQDGKASPAGIKTCRAEVLQECNIDIAEFLSEKVRLGQSYRQILEELRSFNTSVCLRRHFGVSPGSIGVQRRMRTWGSMTSRHVRQERPPHLRPEILHHALRERGRAIPPASHVVPKVNVEKETGPKPPLPGMRPPMGGAGHVVPAPKTGGGTMSIVMPLYTIGIVIFFMYTIMKFFVRKSSGEGMRDFEPDPEFRRVVFADEPPPVRRSREPSVPKVKTFAEDTTRLGWKEHDTRDVEINHLRRRLEETEKAMERIVAQMGAVPGALQLINAQNLLEDKKPIPGDNCNPELNEKKEKLERDQVDTSKELLWDEGVEEPPRVQVLGVETRARVEGGQEWRSPPSPSLGLPHSRPVTPLPPTPEPHNIFLEGSLPSQSQLLVEDAETEMLQGGGSSDPPVILSGKMTLTLINVVPVEPPPDQDFDTWLDPDSTLHDVDSAVIDDTSKSARVKKEKEVTGCAEEEQENKECEEEATHYTTATVSLDAAEAEDTAADISILDIADDQEDMLQEEYDAIWGTLEGEENGLLDEGEAKNFNLQGGERQHNR